MPRPPDWLPVLLWLLSAGALAADPATRGNQGEIIVRAQSATVQQQQGIAEYVGEAELIQGQRHLRGDRIRIHLQDNQPQRVEASGEPVRLTEGETLEASARRLVYDMQAQRIWLYDGARVEHEGRLFEGAELEYRLDTREVKARSAGEGDRVKLVIPAEDGEQDSQTGENGQ